MGNELDDDWTPEVTTNVATHETPELGVSKNKMRHVVIRVGDMDKTIKFYQDVFGMKLLRHRDVPEQRYKNAFLGYGPEASGQFFTIELTHDDGVDSYYIGDGFRAIGLRLPNVDGITKRAKIAGGRIVERPEKISFGPSMIPDEAIGTETFEYRVCIKDPNGYTFEVSEDPSRRDPISKISLLVLNTENSIKFYQDALGMTLLRRRSLLPRRTAQASWLGYAKEDNSTVLELYYEYAREKIDSGNGYGHVAISTPDVHAAAAAVEEATYALSRQPGPVPIIGTMIAAALDTDGYKTVLVDEKDMEKELEKET